MYSVIERGALIKLFRKSLLACIVAGALVMPAHAVTSTEIKQQIDAAIEKQNLAHQIAEYVRSFGEDDSNPAIQFAQEKWAEQQSILIPLYEQYNKAIQEENSKGRYLGPGLYCPTGVQPSNYIWLCLFGRFDSQVVCWRRYCWRHEFDFQHNEIYAGYYSAGLRHSCNYW